MRRSGTRYWFITGMTRNVTNYVVALFLFLRTLVYNQYPPSNWSTYLKLVALLWSLHFIRRIYESSFVHVYGKGEEAQPVLFEYVGGIFYYGFFAIFLARSICCPFPVDSILSPTVFLPAILFLVGEFGNWIHHRHLTKLKRPGDSSWTLPSGLFFDFLVAPHYFFETITWLGFAFLLGSWASIIFLIGSFSTMADLANEKWDIYVTKFDGKEGRPVFDKRARMVPFIW